MDAFSPAPAVRDEPFGPPCPGCDRPRTESDARGLAWSSHHTPDGVGYLCPGCTRSDIAQIEVGLPGLRPARSSPAA
jgi:hypothetical protein